MSNNVPDNQSAKIFAALCEAYPDCDGDAASLIQYALCDLRHLADKSNLAFAHLDRQAFMAYRAERSSKD